jgi:hypothetical protein
MRLPAASSLAVVAVMGFAFGPPASAVQLQVQGGRSYMDRYATNTAFVEAVFASRRIGDSRFSWAPDVSAGWIGGRQVARYDDSRYRTRDDVWLLAAGARFQYGDAMDGRGLFLSVQPALQRGRTQALSGGYEFVSTLGWQGRRFSVQIRHVSNAGLHEPNRGETMALLGVGFDL